MPEVRPSNLEGGITTEASLPPERLGALGCSDVAPEALAYCLRQGLWHYLLVALDLVREYFASVQACQLRLDQEPEAGEAWLVLEVTLQEVETFLVDYDGDTDYRLDTTNIDNPKTAQAIVQRARRMTQSLDGCFAEPKLSHIRRAMQAWEQRIAGTSR